MNQSYQNFVNEIKEISCLETISGLLNWDHSTMMPVGGNRSRAEQMKLVSKLAHEKLIHPKIGNLLAELTAPAVWQTLAPAEQVNVREIKRSYDRAIKIPTSLIEELVHATTYAQQAWEEAREKSQFPIFQPHLEKVLALTRQVATCLAFSHPYEALLEDYEPGLKVEFLQTLFAKLKNDLVELLPRIREKQKKFASLRVNGTFPRGQQEALGNFLLKTIGFDRNKGRLDPSVHPFCMGMPDDVRVTTRYFDDDPRPHIGSVLHEGGHALYEQGFQPEYFYTPMAKAVSMGIHESQSRLIENQIGRSRPFLKFLLPTLRQYFPDSFKNISEEELFYWFNQVQPGLIRVEADEVTYNLHIILRFELELGLVLEEIAVAELPSLWNKKMKEMLELTPPSDREGVLQDIHWSYGNIGYFPTYTLGNLYAAQWFQQIKKEIPGLDDKIANGELAPVKSWLNQKIHRHGSTYRSGELCQKITGEPLREAYFINYLQEKFEV